MKELKEIIKKNNINDKLLINFNKALKDPDFKSLIDTLGLSYEELSKYTSILAILPFLPKASAYS